MSPRPPERRVFHRDALAWLAENPASEGMSVVTSLPDVSELSGMSLDGWRGWFVEAAERVIRWVPRGGVAIFFQSDIRKGGVLVDKGYLVMRAAEACGVDVLWHKIVCRKPAGTVSFGRPSYSHMIAVAPKGWIAPRSPGPDVVADAGLMTWTRAMGVTACRVACAYLRDNTATDTVVDPFCGRGTALAVANAMGFAAIGVELNAKRSRTARTLSIDDADGVSRRDEGAGHGRDGVPR